MRRRMIVDLSSARLNLIFNARRHLKSGLSESEHALDVTAQKILEQLLQTNHKTLPIRDEDHSTHDDSYETGDAEPAVVSIQTRTTWSEPTPLRLVHR